MKFVIITALFITEITYESNKYFTAQWIKISPPEELRFEIRDIAET